MPPKKETNAKTKKPKKVTKKTVAAKPVEQPVKESELVTTVVSSPRLPAALTSRRFLFALVVLVIVGALAYRLGPWLMPAWVGNEPISRFALINRLENAYGAQTLDDMVNEKILDNAIAKANVNIPQERVDEEMKKIEEQFASLGGLDEALKSRGMSRAELRKQVSTQIAVEELLKDKIQPTEEEILKEYETGKATLYKDQKLDEAKDTITANLKQAKLRDEFLVWFSDIKKDMPVRNFFSN